MPETPPTDRDTPLRLTRAVELAFPEGGMTVSGLRREIGRGRLEAESIAGKTFVTLAGIEQMRELCRVQRSRGTTSAQPWTAHPPAAANCEVALASALRAATALRERYKANPSRPVGATR